MVVVIARSVFKEFIKIMNNRIQPCYAQNTQQNGQYRIDTAVFFAPIAEPP